jgi:hypothetical protein
MRRRQASIMLKAGESPSNAPASLPDPRFLEIIRAAASLGRRRSNMRPAFWPCSATGFMLGAHEASVSSPVARVTLRDVGFRHDLCPRGKGRHEDVFRSSDSRRPTRRTAACADIQRARLGIAFIAGTARARAPAPGRRFPLPELFGYAEQRRNFPESGVREHRGLHGSATAARRRRHADGRRSAWPAEFHVLHDVAGVSRHSHRGCEREKLEWQDDLQFEFGVPRPAGRAEFARAAVRGTAAPAPAATASHAALAHAGTARPLTTACSAGGLHGG